MGSQHSTLYLSTQARLTNVSQYLLMHVYYLFYAFLTLLYLDHFLIWMMIFSFWTAGLLTTTDYSKHLTCEFIDINKPPAHLIQARMFFFEIIIIRTVIAGHKASLLWSNFSCLFQLIDYSVTVKLQWN